MYMKVYYYRDKAATVAQVKAALPSDVQGLTVDANLGYPCVEFPDGATPADWTKVQQVLQAAGFETE